MALTERGFITTGGLKHILDPAASLFTAFLAVLAASVLTLWTLDRWAVSAIQIGVYVLAIVAAARAGLAGAGWPASWLQAPLWIIPVWGGLQLCTHTSIYVFDTWASILNWLSVALAFGVALQLFEDATLRRRFRLFAVCFGGCIALWAILQLFSAHGKILWIYRTPETDMPMGPFLNRDYYSAFIELLLPLALWEALHDRRLSLLYAGLAAVMYASVIAGASRAGSVLVNLELGAVLIPAFSGRGGALRGTSRIALQLALTILVCSAVVGWDVLLKRFEAPDPFAGRREDWQAGLLMLRDRPWLGFGLGTWTTAYPGYAVFDAGAFVNAAHSDWLQWAGEGGLPFAWMLLSIAGRALYLGLKHPWGLGICFVFLHCTIDFPLQKLPIFLWLIAVLAALEASNRNTFRLMRVSAPALASSLRQGSML